MSAESCGCAGAPAPGSGPSSTPPTQPTDAAGPRTIGARLAGCLRSGALAGGKQALWLLAFMIPISLGVRLLAMSGALQWLADRVAPALSVMGIPGETAVALVSAALLNIYSGIAALGSMTLTGREVTILAFFMLSFHNLPIEVAVQRRAGSSAWKILVLRLATALAGALLLNLVMPAGGEAAPDRALKAPTSWLEDTAWLVGKVLVLVAALMILQKVLVEFGIARYLARLLSPVLLVLGLPRSTAFLWIAMNTLGLAYGAGVLIEEVQSGQLPKEDVELLNRSAAVCHSLLEDTLLFVAIGAWAVWIIVPRLVLAAAVVWGTRAWRRLQRRPAAAGG
ncbi:MAG TPA: nucleoside recognition protein [Planctomycetota bacterium]|nr:nucleoside recognition protein [Planctomycetota bacterium]